MQCKRESVTYAISLHWLASPAAETNNAQIFSFTKPVCPSHDCQFMRLVGNVDSLVLRDINVGQLRTRKVDVPPRQRIFVKAY